MQLKNPGCRLQAARMSKDLRLEKNVTLEYGSFVLTSFVGKYTYINMYSLIDKNTESIGRFCSIAHNVKIGLGSHPIKWASTHPFAHKKSYGLVKEDIEFEKKVTKRCIIGNDVWIGANAIILAGVKVGDGAIIGANSLVTEDVEPFSIVFGNPAKHQRFRFDNETISALQKLQWWNWNENKLAKNIDLFSDPKQLVNSNNQ